MCDQRTTTPLLRVLPLVFAVTLWAAAQGAPASGSGAALASSALAALANGAPPASVTLTGNAVWTAGSATDTGTVTLEATGAGSSRVEVELGGGSRVTTRRRKIAANGWVPLGQQESSGALAAGAAAGVARMRPPGDSLTPAVWFFPALALSDAGAATTALADLGAATWNGAPADRLQIELSLPQKSAAMTAELGRLSRAVFYLDPTTHFPLALDYESHPGGIVNRAGVRVEIRYGDWRRVSGVEVPYHLERWIAGTRQLVVTLTQAEINPSLSATAFQLGGAQ